MSVPVCGCHPSCGLPTCTGCGEDHGGHDHGGGKHPCRDCDIEFLMTRMQCSQCGRMRYATDSPVGNLGESLWGRRCECTPFVAKKWIPWLER